MRLGLIGCGNVAEFGHLPAILSTPGLELTALLDPVPGRAEDYARRFGGKAFTSSDAFFKERLDVVTVTSSAPAHLQNVLEAAKHGVHVMCEKPIAMTDREGARMVAAMKKAGKEFFVGFCYRFSPVAQQIRRWVAEGVVGEIKCVRLVYIWGLHGQYMQDPDGKWIESPYYLGRMVEGGPLVDCGVHQIDLARWWLRSDPANWSSAGAWVTGYEAPDHVWLHMYHANGATSTVEVSYSYGHTARNPRNVFTYELIGEGGVIRYDRDGYILEARHGQGVLTAPGASEKNFPGMYAALVERLNGGDVEMPTAEDAIMATKIARRAVESAIASRTGPTPPVLP
ncbi:MAG TPA: Gfo/Idh/MocA family oxidoreductase [Fimbriimonadaceae bacterium]|nr:Gfo/Idh/MocA family oxidoreductase [Fimbriimonadaceae bacterium]